MYPSTSVCIASPPFTFNLHLPVKFDLIFSYLLVIMIILYNWLVLLAVLDTPHNYSNELSPKIEIQQ